MTKDNILKTLLTKPVWNQKEVVELVKKTETKYIPNQIQVGDIFFHFGINHPVLVLGKTLGVVLTTTQRRELVCEIKSRFIEGWMTCTLLTILPEDARKTFICVHDDRLQVHRIKKKVKQLLTSYSEQL